jgi:Homeodomain-like domain
MRTGRPVVKIELSAEVRGVLEGYRQRRKTAQALALRARIVLGCASGLSNKTVAARERVTVQTVGKWRRRFVERGVDGLRDEPRAGVPRKIDDAEVESVIVQTLESQPRGATHWSTRSMARHGASRPRASAASGAPSVCSRIVSRPSSSPPIRCL